MELPNDNDKEMIDSKEFLTKLDSLNRRLNDNAEERDATNSKLHKALLSLEYTQNALTQTTKAQDGVLSGLAQSVGGLTESMRRVEMRIIGDSSLGSTGLSQAVSQHEVKLTDYGDRIDELETNAKGNTKTMTILISVIAAIGGLIMWVKGSGLIKWLTGGP